jgi:hypothetical protein
VFIYCQLTGYDSAGDRVQHLLAIVFVVQGPLPHISQHHNKKQVTTPARTAPHTPQSKAKQHISVLGNVGIPGLHRCDVHGRARGCGGRRGNSV